MIELKLYRKLGVSHVFIGITDRNSGKKDRLTVYKIALDGDKSATVIGREVTVAAMKRIVAKLIKAGV